LAEVLVTRNRDGLAEMPTEDLDRVSIEGAPARRSLVNPGDDVGQGLPEGEARVIVFIQLLGEPADLADLTVHYCRQRSFVFRAACLSHRRQINGISVAAQRHRDISLTLGASRHGPLPACPGQL